VSLQEPPAEGALWNALGSHPNVRALDEHYKPWGRDDPVRINCSSVIGGHSSDWHPLARIIHETMSWACGRAAWLDGLWRGRQRPIPGR